MKKVVFACVHNAGRSQIAAALFNQLADPDQAQAVSAGTEPASRIHPEVVAAMAEVGLDLSTSHPRRMSEEVAQGTAVLVTMGCGESCPFVPGAILLDWPIPDPGGKPLAEVRTIRDAIGTRVSALLREQGWMKQA